MKAVEIGVVGVDDDVEVVHVDVIAVRVPRGAADDDEPNTDFDQRRRERELLRSARRWIRRRWRGSRRRRG